MEFSTPVTGTFADENGTTLAGTPRPWYDRDDLKILPHWWKYDIDKIPSEHFYIIGLYIGAVGIVGTFGNSLVIYTYFKNRSLRTPPNMFVINLAISDLVFSAVNGFPLFTISSFQKRWTWGQKTCELYGLIGGIFGFISINTNAAIALDRYFVIAQPIQALRRMTRARAGIVIAFIWFWCILWSLLPIGGFGAYVPEGFQTSCTFDYLTRTYENLVFNGAIYIIGFVIPFGLIMFAYYKIVRTVMIHEDEMKKMAQKLGAKDMRSGAEVRNDLKTAKVGFTISFCYLMGWGPYALLAFLALLGHTSYLNPYVSELPVLFAKSTAMWNPIIYAISHPKFRYAMEKEVPFLFACCPTKQPITRGSTSQASKMSESSDVGGGSMKKSDMKMAQSTTTLNTVAGGVDAASTPDDSGPKTDI